MSFSQIANFEPQSRLNFAPTNDKVSAVFKRFKIINIREIKIYLSLKSQILTPSVFRPLQRQKERKKGRLMRLKYFMG